RRNTMHPDAVIEVDLAGFGASGQDMRMVTKCGHGASELGHVARNAARWPWRIVLREEAEGLAAARGRRRGERQKWGGEIAGGGGIAERLGAQQLSVAGKPTGEPVTPGARHLGMESRKVGIGLLAVRDVALEDAAMIIDGASGVAHDRGHVVLRAAVHQRKID